MLTIKTNIILSLYELTLLYIFSHQILTNVLMSLPTNVIQRQLAPIPKDLILANVLMDFQEMEGIVKVK